LGFLSARVFFTSHKESTENSAFCLCHSLSCFPRALPVRFCVANISCCYLVGHFITCMIRLSGGGGGGGA
jgi:hypothetical protein